VARARRLASAASTVRVARGAPGAGWRVSGECAAGDGDDGAGGAAPCTRPFQALPRVRPRLSARASLCSDARAGLWRQVAEQRPFPLRTGLTLQPCLELMLIWSTAVTAHVAGCDCLAACPCAASSASFCRQAFLRTGAQILQWRYPISRALVVTMVQRSSMLCCSSVPCIVHHKAVPQALECRGWAATLGLSAEAARASQAHGSMWRRPRPAVRMGRRGSTRSPARPRPAAARRRRAARSPPRPPRPAACTRTGMPRGPICCRGPSCRLAPARLRPTRRPRRRAAGRLRLAHPARRGGAAWPCTRRRLPWGRGARARTRRALPQARRARALACQAQPLAPGPWRRVRLARPLGRPCWQTRCRTMQLRAHQPKASSLAPGRVGAARG
jgi:hypothetical protein